MILLGRYDTTNKICEVQLSCLLHGTDTPAALSFGTRKCFLEAVHVSVLLRQDRVPSPLTGVIGIPVSLLYETPVLEVLPRENNAKHSNTDTAGAVIFQCPTSGVSLVLLS
ncbi:unnamed protein product [Ectocarpus sp. 4 AP-2014]